MNTNDGDNLQSTGSNVNVINYYSVRVMERPI